MPGMDDRVGAGGVGSSGSSRIRRMALNKSTSRIVVCMLAAAACLFAFASWDVRRPTSVDAAAAIQGVADEYGVEIVTDNPDFPVQSTHGVIDGKRAGHRQVENYAGLFICEFQLYPRELVRRSRLKRVVFCTDLSFAGEVRGAIPDFEHDTLYIDIVSGAYDKSYLRKGIHHEYFHMLDYRDDGLVYQDTEWKSLNSPGFAYGDGGKSVQSIPTTSLLTADYPGFLNHYSTTGVEEDKAELFANMMVSQPYVMDRVRSDPVLNAKVLRMKAILAAFCPEVDGAFWDRARNATRRN